MKWNQMAIGLAIVTSLLAGCGQTGPTSNQSTSNQPQSQTGNTTGTNTETVNDMKQGVTSMLTLTDSLSKQVGAGDQPKATDSGEQLEATWHAFEDAVNARYPQNYKDVEKYLDPLVAGTKATPFDKKAMSTFNQHLQTALQSLQKAMK